MSIAHSQEVLVILKKHGWFEGRRIDAAQYVPSECVASSEAIKVIEEYGGLHIGESGPGVDCATSDVRVTPRTGVYLANELKKYEASLGVRLFCLGDVVDNHGYIVIDSDGKLYILYDGLEYLAPSFSEALEMLLLGLNEPR